MARLDVGNAAFISVPGHVRAVEGGLERRGTAVCIDGVVS